MRIHAFCAMQSADWTDAIGASCGQLFRTRDEGGEWGLNTGFPSPIYPVKGFGS
jgi:hypothetical protein